MRIGVTYPLPTGEMVLRTAADWNRDVPAVGRTGDHWLFEIPVTGTSLALKPCIRRGDRLDWSRGPDYVISAHESDPDIWPYFYSEERGRVSEILVIGDHAVRIYYPPGYEENTLRTFPVLYMQDGQNLFFPEDAFAGNEWRVDETMDRLDKMNAIRKAIVIGVAPKDRMRDYTSPGYHAYGRYMVDTLKPAMDAMLRSRPGAEDTVVMGSSLGGVASLFLAWEHPTVFGRAACLSSTFSHENDLFQRISSEPRRNILVYLDSGWPRDNYDATNAMRDLMVHRGYRLGVDLLQFSFPDGLHDEMSWAGRIHIPFQFFFGRSWDAGRR